MALDFPEHMNEKNTRVVSKLLAFFLNLSAFHSAFSGFNPWIEGRNCVQNIGKNREWRRILPLPIPMKIVTKSIFKIPR